MVAEKTGTYQLVGSLGPVEFRDLEYLIQNGWQPVESLLAVRSCSSTQTCNLDQPYGVRMVGDHVVAGSVDERPKDGELLWTSGFVTLNVVAHPNAHLAFGLMRGNNCSLIMRRLKFPKACSLTFR